MSTIFLIFSIFFSCSVYSFQQNKIIGENDLVAVNADASNIPMKYKNLVNAFGLLSMSCTATHIGNGYVLTAGHCFWVGAELAVDLPCADISVQWGLREQTAPYLKSSCEKIVFAQRNATNDFAILKVYPIPDTAIRVELSRVAVPTDTVTIFSHPQELPLRWSGACVIESVLDPKLSVTTLQHKCDTIQGSSGAAILDANTNKVIGIHNGGRSGDAGTGMNYGTFIMSPELLKALRDLGFN